MIVSDADTDTDISATNLVCLYSLCVC